MPEKSVVPLLDITGDTTFDAAKEASPIAGGKIAHKKEEVKRVREIVEEHPWKKPKSLWSKNLSRVMACLMPWDHNQSLFTFLQGGLLIDTWLRRGGRCL